MPVILLFTSLSFTAVFLPFNALDAYADDKKTVVGTVKTIKVLVFEETAPPTEGNAPEQDDNKPENEEDVTDNPEVPADGE